MKIAKLLSWNQPMPGVLAILIGAIVTVQALAEKSETPSASPDYELGVEVLSVSVSKLARDPFGKAINPYASFTYEGEGGTVVFSKITPRWLSSTPWKLQEKKCRLLSFKDDVGTVLYAIGDTKLGEPVFSANRPLEILTVRDSSDFGLKLRSARLPAPTANRLTAEVLLVFGQNSEERAAQKSDVLVQTNEVVTVGPLKVKFTEGPSYKGRLHTYATTKYPCWVASILPKKDDAVASVTFFSDDSDEPILVAKNVSAEGNASSSNTGISTDDFSNLEGHSFNLPANRKITIKLRYNDVSSLVEKHYIISTGLSP